MAQINSVNNRSSTLTVDNLLTVTAGGASITGTSTIDGSNAAVTIRSGTGQLDISADAAATTVNLATGAAAKTVTLGSTNSTSKLDLKFGTSDFSLASATGSVIVAQDTGEVTMPLQPAFLAYLGTTVTNVTGNGTPWQLGTTTALTEIYDINGDFNTNGTFTAPVTGKYTFAAGAIFIGCTNPASGQVQFVASNRTLNAYQYGAGTTVYGLNAVVTVDMDAGDTLVVNFVVNGEAGNTDDIQGDASNTWFSGYLVC